MAKKKETELLYIEEEHKEEVTYTIPVFDSMTVDAEDDPSLVPDGSLEFVIIAPSAEYTTMFAMLKAWTPKVKAGGSVVGVGYRQRHIQQALNEAYGKHHTFNDGSDEDRWHKDV